MTLAKIQTGRSDGMDARRSLKDWYHSPDGDVFVWTDPQGSLLSFQITCFQDLGGDRREMWLEWSKTGLRAGVVDSKEAGVRSHDIQSPVVEISTGGQMEAAHHVVDFLFQKGRSLPDALLASLLNRISTS